MTVTLNSITYRGLLIAFKAILDFGYYYFVAPIFGYLGFDLTYNLASYTEAWALYIGLLLFVPFYLKKPSDFLIFMLFATTIAPMLSLYGLSEQDSLYTYSVAAVFILIVLVTKGPQIKIPYIKNGTGLMILISLGVVIISLAQMTASGAIFRINFDISRVYEFREETGDVLFAGIWGYIIPWTSKVFTIILLAYALLKKKYFIVACLVIFQIVLFGITAHKGVAVYPIFAIGLYLFRNSKNIMLYLLLSLILFLLACMASYLLLESKLLPSLFIRRVFFVPALLKYQYYEYFTNHGFVYWSNSVFSSLSNYPFHLPPVNLIGSVYYGDANMGANTGFLATSYMHFGFPGMFFLGAIVAILIKLADAFAKGSRPVWFYLAFLAIPFYGLFANAALLTTLLTHGLGIAIIMAWMSYNCETTDYEERFVKLAPVKNLGE